MLRRKSLGASIALFILLLIAPLIIPKFYIYILAVIFATALLAMSLNLVVGHGGLFQFHHAAFYGVGAYTAGLILAKTSWPWWLGFIAGPGLSDRFVGDTCCRFPKRLVNGSRVHLDRALEVRAFLDADLGRDNIALDPCIDVHANALGRVQVTLGLTIDGNRLGVHVGFDFAFLANGQNAVLEFDGAAHLVLPGLINTHHHLYQTLTRVMAQDADGGEVSRLKSVTTDALEPGLFEVPAGFSEQPLAVQ